MFCRFKDWRRVAMRFDRNIKSFMATIAIAATVIWWLCVRTLVHHDLSRRFAEGTAAV
jgi:hypothetical protein